MKLNRTWDSKMLTSTLKSRVSVSFENYSDLGEEVNPAV